MWQLAIEMTGTYKIEPFLKWAGGKRWLTRNGYRIYPAQFQRYLEPFVGGGAVFFSLQQSPFVISDLNSDLINCYQNIRENWQKIWDLLKIHQQNHDDDYYYETSV